jgi:hypothetical protein
MVATPAVKGGETERLLGQGQEAARRGDKEAARSILSQVVERDPHNEQAWMWLSGVVAEPEEQQICLENVLVINPNNAKARRGLDFISQKTGIPANSKGAADEAASAEAEAEGESTDITSPLGSDPSQHAAASAAPAEPPEPAMPPPVMGPAAASGPGLPEWLQAAIASGQSAESAAPAPTQEPAPSIQDVLSGPFGGGMQGDPMQGDPMQGSGPFGQPSSQYNAQHLSSFDLSGNLQPFSPFGDPMQGTGSLEYGPMGPMGGDVQLPKPDELPNFKDAAPAQPWYLQGTSSAVAASAEGEGAEERAKRPIGNVTCPSCKVQVTETSLACPNCRYNFFVHCPHCHELVDAVDAQPNKKEACPYCSETLDRFELGVTGTERGAAYISERVKHESEAEAAMQKIAAKERRRRGRTFTFGWLVDLLWLVAIVATVWALSQLPVWLKLVNQY